MEGRGQMKVFQILVSLIMVIIMPIMNLGYSLKKPADASFTEPEAAVKKQREEYEFTPSENDIILDGGELNEAVSRAVGAGEAVTIWLHGGEYLLDDTIRIENGKNITVCACPGEKVSVSSGRQISGWTESTANGVKVWTARVPEGTDFMTLFKGDEKLPVTRYPENGYLLVENSDRENALFTDETSPWQGWGYGDTSFFAGKDLKYDSFRNLTDVRIKLMHFWFCESTRLKSIDGRKITVEMPCSMKVEANQRYFLENVFEELNSPGEWYLDRQENTLYYVPRDGESMESTVLFAPSLTKFFDISGSENISFKNIIFKNSDWCYSTPDPSVGWLDNYGLLFPQGNLECEGAAEITKSKGINFINCDFLNIGNCAIRFHREVSDSVVSGCTFREIGSNVVFIDGWNTEDEALKTKNIRVYDNLIEGYGRNFPSGIGVLITHGSGCEIDHNEIHDGYYTAISLGWMWGYSYSASDYNRITNNHIYDIGQGWLSDMGGIYTLGIQAHTVLSGNKIHNVAADPNEGGYGGWGIYLDEGSSRITVEKNLVYDCGSNSFHQHYGEDNLIRNNIFALSAEGQIRSSRQEEHNEFILTGNIIVSNDQPMYLNTTKNRFTDGNNLYWDYANHSAVLSSDSDNTSFEHRLYRPVVEKLGYYNDGIFEDPLFRDPLNFDFILADNSPALEKIGFERWNYNEAGTVTDFS